MFDLCRRVDRCHELQVQAPHQRTLGCHPLLRQLAEQVSQVVSTTYVFYNIQQLVKSYAVVKAIISSKIV